MTELSTGPRRDMPADVPADLPWVAVGVDGSEAARAATQWAAREAARAGTSLRVVHAFTEVVPVGTLYASAYPLTPIETRAAAAHLVEEAARVAEQALPASRVARVLLRSDPRNALLQTAGDARLLVLGGAPRPTLERLVTGSVVASVAAHAPCPVVVVPASWADRTDPGPVVVGVKGLDTAPQLVREGLALAQARGTGLTVLHAWEFLAQYDDAIAAHADLPAWEERARQELQSVVDAAAAPFPGVAVETRLVHGQPAQALVHASEDAGLLVVSRRPHGFPFGHLGGTGRAILRETRCPTMVLPPRAAVEELEAEEAGEAAAG